MKKTLAGRSARPAHEVGVPLAAEGDVDADVVSLGDELALQIAANAKKHLKFEMTAVDVALRDKGFGGRDHFFVVRGEAVVDRALQQHVAELYVVGVDVGFFGEGDFARLLVRALAEADANSFGDKLLDVSLRAEEVRLDDDADGAAQFGLGVNAAHDVERDLGELRVFHVDADKVAGRLARAARGSVAMPSASAGSCVSPIWVNLTLMLESSLRAAIRSRSWW